MADSEPREARLAAQGAGQVTAGLQTALAWERLAERGWKITTAALGAGRPIKLFHVCRAEPLNELVQRPIQSRKLSECGYRRTSCRRGFRQWWP